MAPVDTEAMQTARGHRRATKWPQVPAEKRARHRRIRDGGGHVNRPQPRRSGRELGPTGGVATPTTPAPPRRAGRRRACRPKRPQPWSSLRSARRAARCASPSGSPLRATTRRSPEAAPRWRRRRRRSDPRANDAPGRRSPSSAPPVKLPPEGRLGHIGRHDAVLQIATANVRGSTRSVTTSGTAISVGNAFAAFVRSADSAASARSRVAGPLTWLSHRCRPQAGFGRLPKLGWAPAGTVVCASSSTRATSACGDPRNRCPSPLTGCPVAMPLVDLLPCP